MWVIVFLFRSLNVLTCLIVSLFCSRTAVTSDFSSVTLMGAVWQPDAMTPMKNIKINLKRLLLCQFSQSIAKAMETMCQMTSTSAVRLAGSGRITGM